MPVATLETPVGLVGLEEADDALTQSFWARQPATGRSALLAEALAQLHAYFAGRLRHFDLPLAPPADPFHGAFREALLAIPYGETRTYGDLARSLGTHAQAVGAACGANPIPIIVPCHRVLSATGIGGFSGGLGVETKIALLKLEGGFPFLL